MESKLKWGVIGSGGIARRRTIPEGFVPAENARLVSVYGTNAQTNTEVAREYNLQALDTLESLLASDIDAVYVASPVQAHLTQVLACAKAGKHVLCEKPYGRTVAEAEAMVNACRQAGVALAPAFMMRFHSQHLAAMKLIRDGLLGKPVYARAQLSCWYPPINGAWRQDPATGGGGSLIDMGSHCLDLLEMLFGPVVSVSCFIRTAVHSYASEDSAAVLLRFANGALGTVDTFFCIPDHASRNALELYGSQGSILASGTIGQASQGEMTAYLESVRKDYEAQQNRAGESGLKIPPDPVNIYRAEIEAFSHNILNGTRDSAWAESGLRNQRLIAACYESARAGQAIAID